MRLTVTFPTRGLVALLAALALTAFAPAPLPRAKRERAAEGVRAQDIQGVWRAIAIEEKQTDGRMVKQSWPTNGMAIRGDQWSFLTNGKENFSLWMKLDGVQIDLWTSESKAGTPALAGVLRRRGNSLQMLYTFGGPSGRPTDFEKIPAGCRVMSLERER